MRFLVLGATGMAGHVISTYLAEQGHVVTGFSRRPARFLDRAIAGDASNLSCVEEAIAFATPDVIVNCIGLLNRSCEDEPDKAVYLNSYFPHWLESITRETVARVFHLSTDCVFAGNTGPYSEESFPDGRSLYDRSKALGELVNDKDLTLRQSIVGPDIDPKGIGLLNWFMSQRGPVKGYTRAIWTGLTTLELAKAVERCAQDGSTGLVNMVPDSSISKYELIQLFNEFLRGGSIDIDPDDGLLLDKTLARTNRECSFVPAPYEQQIQELSIWLKGHRSLYPHYPFG